MTWDVVIDAVAGGVRGDLVPLTTTVKVNGVLTNATMAVTVRAPNAAESTPAVTNTSTGIYTANVPITQVGDYLYWWDATGAVTAVQQGQFSVDAVGLRLLSLDDARAHLNRSSTAAGTADDEELRQMIDAITAMVERVSGPVIPKTYAETITSYGDDALQLSYAPVISLTSVVTVQTPYVAPLLASLAFDAEKGAVYYTAGGALPYGRFRITYRAGRQPIPSNVREAAKIILAHMWESQRGGSATVRAGGFGAEDVTVVPGMGFALPNMARDLLLAHPRIVPAVA